MSGVISSVIHLVVYLGCLYIAAEIIQQLNISRFFTKNTALIGFLLSLALGSLIFSPISYGLSYVLALLTQYSEELASVAIAKTVIGLIFFGALLMLYNQWRKP